MQIISEGVGDDEAIDRVIRINCYMITLIDQMWIILANKPKIITTGDLYLNEILYIVWLNKSFLLSYFPLYIAGVGNDFF